MTARRAIAKSRLPLRARIWAAAASPAARKTYIVVGAVGLAGIALAIFGPRRFQREVLKPLARTAASESEKLWNDTQSLRQQFRALMGKVADPKGREVMVRDFQSWIGHFRAS